MPTCLGMRVGGWGKAEAACHGAGCLLCERCVQAPEVQTASCVTLPTCLQAFGQLWSEPEAECLQQPQAGDAHPDMSEALLHLSACFVRNCCMLQPGASQLLVLNTVLAAASSCAGCCHKRVGNAALGLLLALLTAATDASQPPQLLSLVAAHGALCARGALSALMVCPLPRLQKVCSLLLELAAVAAAAASTGASAPSKAAAQSQALLHGWLAAAADTFTPQPLSQQEAASLAQALSELLLPATPVDGRGGAAARGDGATRRHSSLLAARKLKRRLRDFAEHLGRM